MWHVRAVMLRVAVASVLLLLDASSATAALISGSVVGPEGGPFGGAIIEVVSPNGERRCATVSPPDGRFALPCDASGPHTVRASSGNLQPWEIADVELAPDRTLELNFLLGSTNVGADTTVPLNAAPEPAGFWTRRLPNPVVAHWGAMPVTLRAAAVAAAAIAFVLGALTMIALGRRLGVEVRRLSPDAVGDLLLNPQRPAVGERLTPIAVVGARGAEATISYGADEIAAALAAGRYGMVFVALVIAPGLFALGALAFAFALLAGQEAYLFYGMLMVPAGFVLTALIIGVQAMRLARRAR